MAKSVTVKIGSDTKEFISGLKQADKQINTTQKTAAVRSAAVFCASADAIPALAAADAALAAASVFASCACLSMSAR